MRGHWLRHIPPDRRVFDDNITLALFPISGAFYQKEFINILVISVNRAVENEQAIDVMLVWNGFNLPALVVIYLNGSSWIVGKPILNQVNTASV